MHGCIFMTLDSAHRSERSTPEGINARIRRETERAVASTLAGGPLAIAARLAELDREWDTERTLETMAATFALTGVALGATVDRRWLWLPGVVGAFLLQHGLQGWCPPLPAIRALGVRTQGEIEQERYALKAARGDFDDAPSDAAGARRLLAQASR